jgi:radical SAM enzyme (TIGR01210 family)
VIESRPQYITADALDAIVPTLAGKYLEVGIGLETLSDFIRLNAINKGFTLAEFERSVAVCHQAGLGVRAYLILKPPFMVEDASVAECVASVERCIELGVETVSINPMNLQERTLLLSEFDSHNYRPPWFYSLFEVLQTTATPEHLQQTRILSAPAAAGKRRGIHNCRDITCNQASIDALKAFVMSQDPGTLPAKPACNCWLEYCAERHLSRL